MKNILIFSLLFVISCGYQPLYVDKKNNNDFKFQEIKLAGNQNLDRRISSLLSLEENKTDETLNKIILSTKKNNVETSKNVKGQVISYRTFIEIKLIILDNKDNILREKTFIKDFLYNVDDNKFKLAEYQKEIENNLIAKIAEEIILFINL